MKKANDQIRRGLACLVAYRDEQFARGEVQDWTGPLAAGGNGQWTQVTTDAGIAIDKHFGRLATLIMTRTHE